MKYFLNLEGKMGKIELVKPLHIRDGNLYRATAKQTTLLIDLGYSGDPLKLTMNEASSLIDEMLAQQPATQRQIDAIANLGGVVAGDMTKVAASELIEQLFRAVDIERIKTEIPVKDLIGATYTVIGDGNSNRYTTEEHDSLKIFDHNNSWTWYSQAGDNGKHLGGTVIDWYVHSNNCTVGDAVIELWAMVNGRCGYVAPPPRPVMPAAPLFAHGDWKSERWQRVANEALHKCQGHLLTDDVGQLGRDELANRGISTETAEAFGLGYGLVWNRKANGMMPALWLPWFCDNGLTWICARFLGVPKGDSNADRISAVGFHLNDGDSKKYYGTRYLFGLQHCTTADVGELDTLIVVEGEINAMSIFQTVYGIYECDVVSYGPQRNLQCEHVVDLAREVAQRYKHVIVWADDPSAAVDALGTIPDAKLVRSPVIDGKEHDANDLLQIGVLPDVLNILLDEMGTGRTGESMEVATWTL